MQIWRRLLSRVPHLPSVASFGVIQAAQMLLPLLALPYLSRVLGPGPFGTVLYMLAASAVAAMCVEWGFALGAVRDVATHRDAPEVLGSVVGGVLSAKCALALVCMALAAVGWLVLPLAWQHPWGYALAVANGIVLGFNPLWFYQGMGSGVARVAACEMGGGVAVLLLMLALVRQPEHWMRYLLLLLTVRAGSYAWLTLRPLRLVHMSDVSVRAAIRTAGRAIHLFLARLGALGNTHGLTLMMGSALPARDMAMLIAGDKIARCVVSLTTPVVLAIFPELCAVDVFAARRAARRTALWTGASMGVAGAVLWVAAPAVIRVALGGGYAEAVPLLRVFCLLLPLLAVNAVLATHGLVAGGRERALTIVMCVVALPSLMAAPWLVRTFGVAAGAWLPVGMEILILLLLTGLLSRPGVRPAAGQHARPPAINDRA